jgi:hypothetical protein
MHTLTRLASAFGPSEILRAGGGGAAGVDTAACDKYNPWTRTWIPAGRLVFAVTNHTATLCTGCATGFDGKVFVIGGVTSGSPTKSIQMYDPANNSWVNRSSIPWAVKDHRTALVSTTQGKQLLVAGGSDASNVTTKFTMLWPSGTPANMTNERSEFGMTTLQNGKVLSAGGYRSQSGDAIAGAELFTP